MIKRIALLVIVMQISLLCKAQFKNNVWCFGDSAGIKFEPGGITQLFNSSTLTSGGSCSIADSSGNLLFYANTNYYQLWTQGYVSLGVVWDRNHNLMQNGDTLTGGLSFQEQIIVPWPDSSHLFYLFNVGVFYPYGFWYSVIDLNQNGGLGAVVQKRVQLTSYQASDCVAAVKHGNGRDWWVYFRKYDNSNNNYYRYLVTPNGISGPYIQGIGTITNNNFFHTAFSKDGSKFLAVDYRGLIEVFDVDRCSGLFSNLRHIESEHTTQPLPTYFGCDFSASGRYIYVSSNNNTESQIVQFDLLAPNIAASKDTIADLILPPTGGLLKRGPDDKIYFSCVYNDGILTYPYPDTVTSIYNLNLSVINYPDSAGSACDFSPFSFYLGGNETYWGLPNNPEYELNALSGSSCDTLLSVQQILTQNDSKPNLYVYYDFQWQTAFINVDKLKDGNYILSIYDLAGKQIFCDRGKNQPPFFTKNLKCSDYAKGMYLVTFKCGNIFLSQKLIID